MKKSFYILIFSSIIFFGVFVLAQEDPFAKITYPIPELGNCKSRTDCEAYCDKPENMAVCLDFAESHNLIPEGEIEMARKMLALGATTGPGGCRGAIECGAYCDEIIHAEECIAFAEAHGLIPPGEREELEKGKKIVAALKQGIKPPNCKSKSACEIYCMQPENMEECITFGEAAGIIPPEELADVKKTLEAIKKGIKPPACAGKEACDEYCAMDEHFKECLNFAEAAGFMTPEEAVMARKTGGKGPGGCRGKEVCDAFCEDPANMETCISFALEYGFMPPEEVENAKKTLQALQKGVRPPNCRGEEECEIYCSQPEHFEECINFAEAAGFMTPEEAEQARKMAQAGFVGGPGGCKGREECDAYCNEVTHMEECLLFAYESGLIPPEDLENTEKIIGAIKQGVHMLPCRNEEECSVYCATPEHMEECINFSVAAGFMTPEEAEQAKKGMEMMQAPPPEGMPSEGVPESPGFPSEFEGKCTTAQECQQYCLQNPQDPACQAIMPPPEGVAPPPSETPPPETTPPPEETVPPPESPQSLFEQIKNFLASLIYSFGF